MNTEILLERLKELGLGDSGIYRAKAFSRNLGLLSVEELERLSQAKVAIPGMGGVGGVHLITLVRSGVGKFHLADFDVFESANVNRQYGAKVPSFGVSKLEVMRKEALNINPFLEIRAFEEGITEENLDDFLDGVEVVLDGLDFFAFDIRRALFNRAREKGIYVITAGPIGFSTAMLIFSPKEGMSFDEYFSVRENIPEEDKYLAFAMGLTPRATQMRYMDLKKVDLKAKSGPSLNIACQLCSGVAATEALRILLGRGRVKPVPYYFQFDPYVRKYRKGYLFCGNRNPIQRTKMWVAKKLLKRTRSIGQNQAKYPIPPEGLVSKENSVPESVVRFLVAAGTWAPSADNCQPWRFAWDGTKLTLLKDPDRTGFFYDVNQESTLITFGAVMENIRIAATHYGVETSCDMLPLGMQSNVIAEMEFKPSRKVTADPLFQFIMRRQVNRKPYRREPISREIARALTNRVIQISGAQLFWIAEDESKKAFRKIIFDADRILFENERLHAGLFRWIRMGEKDESKTDGMDLSVLGLSRFQQPVFPWISHWWFLSFMNKFGMSRAAALNSVTLLKRSPAYCLITMNERNPLAYIRGGMAMESFWIRANSFGLSLQPMFGFIFLLNHLYHDGAVQFRKDHQLMIKHMQANLEGILQGERKAFPIAFFRLGYSDPPSARTSRRPLDEVMEISKS